MPLSYGRITCYWPIACRSAQSHPPALGGSEEVAVYDVTICAPDGTVVVDIEDYTMRRVDEPFAAAAPVSTLPDRAARSASTRR